MARGCAGWPWPWGVAGADLAVVLRDGDIAEVAHRLDAPVTQGPHPSVVPQAMFRWRQRFRKRPGDAAPAVLAVAAAGYRAVTAVVPAR
jgi:hypothetical protein